VLFASTRDRVAGDRLLVVLEAVLESRLALVVARDAGVASVVVAGEDEPVLAGGGGSDEVGEIG
jgi:hypothetical protein